ncbi:Rv3235 family protein [Demequina aestuarii]|uniref:Rv3235 family protein n=1 Tax=Demequina aestuarii TaxID=327095 RepID=UPI000B0E6AAC|nr:Rv3235 family protein [Demequina aestuarii]
MSAASLPAPQGGARAPGFTSAPPPPSPVPYGRERRVLGDPAPLACTVAKAVMEALLGGPALDPYVRWIAPAVFGQVARQRSLARRAGLARSHPVGVRRARVFRVSRDAAEVSIVVDDGDHCRAIAMRLEDVTGRWLVTEMHVG